MTISGVARNFSQGVRNSNFLQSSIDALHCFCRERNFWQPNASSLAALLNGNLTEVAEMHHGEHTTAARAAHC